MDTVVIGLERNFEAFFFFFFFVFVLVYALRLSKRVFNVVWSINKQMITCLAQGHNGVPLRCYLTISKIEDVCSTFNHINLEIYYHWLRVPEA